MQERWSAVDRYFSDLLLTPDPSLEAALAASDAAGLPQQAVAPNQGKLLQLLATIRGARTILEIGTLGGYSTIWLARALPEEGRLITLEADERNAEVARANLARAGLADRTEVRVGPRWRRCAASKPTGRARSTWSSSTPTSRTTPRTWTGRWGSPGPAR